MKENLPWLTSKKQNEIFPTSCLKISIKKVMCEAKEGKSFLIDELIIEYFIHNYFYQKPRKALGLLIFIFSANFFFAC